MDEWIKERKLSREGEGFTGYLNDLIHSVLKKKL